MHTHFRIVTAIAALLAAAGLALAIGCSLAASSEQETAAASAEASAASASSQAPAATIESELAAKPSQAPDEGKTADDVPSASLQSGGEPGEVSPVNPNDAKHESEYESGTLLVSFAPGLNPEDALAQLAEECGIEGMSIASVSDNYVRIELPPTVSVEEATAAFAQSELIESAQPNFKYHLMDDDLPEAAFDQALASLKAGALAGLATQAVSINDPQGKQWMLESIGAYKAWETARVEQEVTVAVIDNCINVNHEDLKNNVVAPYNAIDDSSVDVEGNSYKKGDPNHGTHVAGIVAAEANNGLGIAGVSYNAQIMPIRAADDNGDFYTESLTRAYDHVIANAGTYNVRVVNMSIGGYWDPKDDKTDDFLFKCIDKAWKAGIVTVTSACNKDDSLATMPYHCYPGDYDKCVNVINLESTTNGVRRNSNSNYNLAGEETKDISAPGTQITSTAKGNSSYISQSGTSMAAPCVAGVLALEFAANLALTPEQAVKVLYETAKDLGDEGFDKEYGWGEVDATAAVKKASNVKGTWSIRTNIAKKAAIALPQTTYTYSGKALTPTPTVSLSGTTLKAGTDYTVAYANNVNAGTATITITGKGSYRGIATKSFTIGKLDLGSVAFALSQTSLVYTGAALAPAVSAPSNGPKLVAGTDYTVAYTGNVNAGKASVSIRAAGANYTGSKTLSFTITPTSLASAQVKLSGTSFTYSGAAFKPTATVRLGSTALKTGTDYTLSYKDNVNAGTATATITGKGNYTGSKSLTFTIGKAALTSASLAKYTYTYNGKAHKPAAKAKSGSTALKSGRDFSVSYSGTVKAGHALATVKGKGNYKGSISFLYTITKAANKLTVKAKTATVKYKQIRKAKLTLARANTLAVSKATGAVTYAKVSGSKYLTIAKKTGKVTVKKGTPRGTYKIKVRVKAAGNSNYKAATKTVTATVRVK